MSKILVLAEKPSVGRDLARVLKLLCGGEFLAIETIKDSKDNLDDFAIDCKNLRELA